MNKVCLIGRLTEDPKIVNGKVKAAKYTLAIDRRGQDAGADFVSCVAFDKRADFVEKYLRKGMKVAVDGRIQTGSYTNKDGKKVYTTDVVVSEHEFCEKKQPEQRQDDSGFMDVSDDMDEEIEALFGR